MVDGCFDPVQIGHVKYFEMAASLGLPLLCNVQSDRYINEGKKRPNLLPEEQRAALIQGLRSISHVHLCKTSTHDVLAQLRPAKYVKGLDWKTRGLPQKEVEVCKEHGIEIVYLDTVLDSSTNIVEGFRERLYKNDTSAKVSGFYNALSAQKIVESRHYDEHYFTGNWREGNNDYSIETRRKIEAKNPQNIKDVFQPRRVLDVGCGPGALMFLLHELGVETYGVDFSKAAREIAPPEVRERIVVGPVTEYHDFGKTFDLVICRELLEHLTILQVRNVVAVLARYASKFLYVTTRYHPSPKHLLDVTDDVKTDPTHITLLTKDLLKTLFILEGLKPREDIEEKMDWKKYGRVLVFEKV